MFYIGTRAVSIPFGALDPRHWRDTKDVKGEGMWRGPLLPIWRSVVSSPRRIRGSGWKRFWYIFSLKEHTRWQHSEHCLVYGIMSQSLYYSICICPYYSSPSFGMCYVEKLTIDWFDIQSNHLNLHRFVYGAAVKKCTLVARGPGPLDKRAVISMSVLYWCSCGLVFVNVSWVWSFCVHLYLPCWQFCGWS